MGFSKQNINRKCPALTERTLTASGVIKQKCTPAPAGTAACPVSLRSLPSSLCCTVMEGLSPSLGARATKVNSEDGALMVR